jgi:integrase
MPAAERSPVQGPFALALPALTAAAGLSGVSPHTLRHTHATWLASAGVPPALAAARLGHADGGALFLGVYAHPGVSEGAAALRALEDFRTRAQPTSAIALQDA